MRLLLVHSMQMTRVRWLIAGFWLLAFWLLAGMVVAPALQSQLEAQASAILKGQPTGYEAVKVQFDGQRAILKGQVRHEDQRAQILSAAEKEVRGVGPLSAKLNPVQQVVDELEIVPYPPGWLLLAANGTRGQLLGAAATEFESRDLYRLIQDRWGAKGGRIESKLKAFPELHDEAPDLKQTLAQIPLPNAREGGDSAQIQIASLGGPWQRLVPDAKDDRLMEQSLAIGISRQEWEKSILPLIQNVRRYQSEQRSRAEETTRQAKLPPPHLFLAARENRLLVRGETATVGIKREFLNALIISFPEWRVIDDVRINPECRAVSDFGPITTALLPDPLNEDSKTKGKSLMCLVSQAMPGNLWTGSSARTAQPWKEDLPKDLPANLCCKTITAWSSAGFRERPKASQTCRSAHNRASSHSPYCLIKSSLQANWLKNRCTPNSLKPHAKSILARPSSSQIHCLSVAPVPLPRTSNRLCAACPPCQRPAVPAALPLPHQARSGKTPQPVLASIRQEPSPNQASYPPTSPQPWPRTPFGTALIICANTGKS
jgi:hypothetical protein